MAADNDESAEEEDEEEDEDRSERASTMSSSSPILIPEIPVGSVEGRKKVLFEVVTAKVVETAGKKHVVSKAHGSRLTRQVDLGCQDRIIVASDHLKAGWWQFQESDSRSEVRNHPRTHALCLCFDVCHLT